MINLKSSFAIIAILLFCGCASKNDTIYHWDGSYSLSVYEYLNSEGDINEQISNLENLVKTAYEKGKKVPPGLHAHLGLLYSNLGNNTKAMYNLNKEAELFPESKAYITFLKNKNPKKRIIENEK